MACERYQGALTDLAAGAPAAPGLEAHLVGCAACRQELDALRRALALVETDLRQLLETEPSPALAARIRRAAAEPLVSPAWRPGRVLQVVAAAALLAVALVVTRGREPGPEPARAVDTHPPPANETPSPGPAARPAATALPSAVASASASSVAVPHPRASTRPLAPPETEVLVPPGEAEALLRLVALLDRDRVAPPVMGAAGQASPDLAELRPIDIAPLEIVPLDPAESSGT
jgi:hypothetical protein